MGTAESTRQHPEISESLRQGSTSHSVPSKGPVTARSELVSQYPESRGSNCFIRTLQRLWNERVLLRPVVRDLLPRCEPDTFVALSVLDELAESTDPTRLADHAAMEPDAHHLGRAGDTLAVQLVEGGDQVWQGEIECDTRLEGY